MPPPNLPTTKIEHVIAWWITLLVMDDGGCSMTFAKATNPNVIKAAATSSCITRPLNLSDITGDQVPKQVSREGSSLN